MSRKNHDVYRLCLVTDRAMAAGRPLADIVLAAVAGGVTMVQIRDKHSSTRDFIAEARAVRERLSGNGAVLVINDRVDVALAVEADGIHVGQDDMDVATVRRLVGPDMLIGLSVTNEDEMRRADGGADYLGVGPVFAQFTKADAAPPLGLDGLARLRTLTGKPVLAIGGIGASNAAAVMQAGADGLAVVSAIMTAGDPQAAATVLRRMADAAHRLTRG